MQGLKLKIAFILYNNPVFMNLSVWKPCVCLYFKLIPVFFFQFRQFRKVSEMYKVMSNKIYYRPQA